MATKKELLEWVDTEIQECRESKKANTGISDEYWNGCIDTLLIVRSKIKRKG